MNAENQRRRNAAMLGAALCQLDERNESLRDLARLILPQSQKGLVKDMTPEWSAEQVRLWILGRLQGGK